MLTPFLFYLLKVSIITTALFAFYYLLLRHETFFAGNRFYALAALAISLLLPVVDISLFFPVTQSFMLPFPVHTNPVQLTGAEHIWRTEDYITAFLVSGMVVLFVRLLIQMLSLLQLKRKTSEGKLYGIKVQLMNDGNPFSFLHWVFIHPGRHHPEEIREIVAHERIHVRQWHTLDILLFEAFSIFCWYNPLAWVMKQQVRQNLEYITDQQVLRLGYDRYQYQHHLLKANQMVGFWGIAASFSHCLQNRITMMNKKPSRRLNLLKYALMIPVCTVLTLGMGAKAEMLPVPVLTNSLPTPKEKEVTLAIDRTVHDFGIIRESDGKTSTVFTVVNLGNTPLIINDVKASCGCTTPEWTKEPIVPGGTGYIKATYDPTNRIYAFDRTLTVYTNGNPSEIVLHIKGTTIKN